MTFEHVVARVPSPSRTRRTTRYEGDDRAARLSEMDAPDRDRVREIYAALQDFDVRLRDAPPQSSVAFDGSRLIELARALGRGGGVPSEKVRSALHDTRGGALASLLLEAQREALRPGLRDRRTLRVLTADHLKVMRNALVELDDERRAADRVRCVHYVERLVATLEGVTSERAGVKVDCRFSGGITTSCMELGALDRAALNVANNAVRHAASDTVHLWLAPAVDQAESDLRIVVVNEIDAHHATTLAQRFGDDLSRLFIEQYSTTGSGDGLRICAEFVSAAYGIPRPEDGVRLGLVGAQLVGRAFVAWLHWPAIV